MVRLLYAIVDINAISFDTLKAILADKSLTLVSYVRISLTDYKLIFKHRQ